MSEVKTLHSNARKEMFFDWILDILIYTIILNLFAEYSTSVYFATFTISIFTAFFLKLVLVVILQFEHYVGDFFKKRKGQIFKVFHLISAFLILFLSKFVILELLDIVFGPQVEIKGFIPLVALIIAMILTRKVMDLIYKKL